VSVSQTRVFGLNLGIDPKIIVLALLVIAGLVYYFTSSSSDTPTGSSNGTSAANFAVMRPANQSTAGRAALTRRSRTTNNDQNALKLVAIDGSRGDVDPTLRLGLLERVKNVSPAADVRNLFDSGGAIMAQNLPPIPKNVPKIVPQQPAVVTADTNVPPPQPPFNIPLKYYGFVKPTGHSLDGSRGFFMDGDNILVGGEGDVLEKRFLIVALTPNSARLEDTQAKQGQELQVTPEAPTSQQN
jgi:hypothetical protein